MESNCSHSIFTFVTVFTFTIINSVIPFKNSVFGLIQWLCLHPQSDRCSSPHGKTFLMKMSPSFRSKTAILIQVRRRDREGESALAEQHLTVQTHPLVLFMSLYHSKTLATSLTKEIVFDENSSAAAPIYVWELGFTQAWEQLNWRRIPNDSLMEIPPHRLNFFFMNKESGCHILLGRGGWGENLIPN